MAIPRQKIKLQQVRSGATSITYSNTVSIDQLRRTSSKDSHHSILPLSLIFQSNFLLTRLFNLTFIDGVYVV